MVYGSSATAVAPWTYSPPTDRRQSWPHRCIQLKEVEHSESGLLYSSPGNPSELSEIMSKSRPCKAELHQQRKAGQVVSLALEGMTFKGALLIPPKASRLEKRGTCLCPGIAPIGHHFAEALFPKLLVLGSKGPLTPQGQLSARMAKGPSLGTHTMSDPKKGLPWPES